MKNKFLAIAISLVTGAIAGAIAISLISKPAMMLEDESRYDFETTLTTIQQSAEAEGWSVPALHDLQKSLAKQGKEVNPVQVFALCNPEYAVMILAGDEERIYSNMMPCRVSVYTKSDGKTYISRMNVPKIARGMPGNVKKAMKDAYRDMEEILSGIVAR
jgi:uncharacterized protein (DUF302 family)